MTRTRGTHQSGADLTWEALHPDLTPEESEECRLNLERYLQAAWEIFERLGRDPAGRETLARLTESVASSSLAEVEY